MKPSVRITSLLCAALTLWSSVAYGAADAGGARAEIRTPRPGAAPRINAAPVFGVRPGHPFLYHIPATGERPLTFSAEGLPAGLGVDAQTGTITGAVDRAGEHLVTLSVANSHGRATTRLKIMVGETIALTPPMGWNSYNHYGSHVTAAIVEANARAMASSGLIEHGWTYVNIDDGWQGRRGGEFNAIQGNERFPDMAGLVRAVHALGLKIGIYSTPWVQSYAGYIGGSASNAAGTFSRNRGPKQPNRKILPWAVGAYSFAKADATQWAVWGFDYLKYDWNPVEPPEAREMYEALRASGRDIVYSLSNNAQPATLIQFIAPISEFANSWRIANDIKANWHAVTAQARTADKWGVYARPGHWNDPDMLEIGTNEHHQPGLTPDEEYAHMTWWCLLSAPLLLGNDLTSMDDFTLGLLTNDEVIAVDQDALGRPAVPVREPGDTLVYMKPLANGGWAVGLFNVGATPARVTAKWSDLKLAGPHAVRDLWRQKDLGMAEGEFSLEVAAHGAELVRIAP